MSGTSNNLSFITSLPPPPVDTKPRHSGSIRWALSPLYEGARLATVDNKNCQLCPGGFLSGLGKFCMRIDFCFPFRMLVSRTGIVPISGTWFARLSRRRWFHARGSHEKEPAILGYWLRGQSYRKWLFGGGGTCVGFSKPPRSTVTWSADLSDKHWRAMHRCSTSPTPGLPTR